MKRFLIGCLLFVGCSDYEIHDQNDALGQYNPPELGAEVKTDRVVQVTVSAVDVLWIIDNSCSMDQEQAGLTQNFASFMEYFTNSGLDYHVGVVSTDMQSNGHSGKLVTDGGTTYIDSNMSSADAIASFGRRARLGTSGSGNEKGLDAGFAALTTHESGYNRGFLREDAALAMIVISDEEDYSNVSVAEFVSWATAIKSHEDLTSFSSIVWTNQCGSGPGGETIGTKYITATTQIGGILWPICDTSWNTVLTELGMQAAGLKREFFLSTVPVESTISVVVNGVEGTEYVFYLGTDFEYDRTRNSITFLDFVPEPLDEVLISYEVLASESFVDELLDSGM